MSKHIIFKQTPFHYHIINPTTTLPCVVLIHGFGTTARIWDNIYPSLSDKYCVIIPELAGVNLSPMPGNNTQWSFAHNAEAIKGILQHENIAQATFVGHSMGGYIGASFAQQYPEYLAGLLFFHSTAKADSAERKQKRDAMIAYIETWGPQFFMRSFIIELLRLTHSLTHIPQTADYMVEAEKFSANFLTAALIAMRDRTDHSHLLENLTCPVGFICGKKDNFVPYNQTLAECILPKKSFIKIIPEAGHVAMLEKSDSAIKALHDFLSYINT